MKDMPGSFAYYWLRKGIDKMAAIYWLIAFVVLLGIEAATMALTTIWFAGGALVAFVRHFWVSAYRFSLLHL